MDDRSAVDLLAAQSRSDSSHYRQWSAPCPIFLPWLHEDFEKLYRRAAPYTLLSPERCYFLASFAVYATYLQGDFAECGVYRGGTALLLANILKRAERTLYLFDSFKGLPKIHQEKDRWFSEGEFAEVRVEEVEELLSDCQKVTAIRPGWIPETFAGLEGRIYAFAHLDLDLYQSTLDSCRYFYPRLVPGGLLLFDEYGFAAAGGEKEAVDEFFADKPESPISLPTGQAIVLKLPGTDAPASGRKFDPKNAA
jgi:O-methyltransferase